MATVLKVGSNPKGRDYVVGDVHGHFDQLNKQLQNLQFDESCDRLFCLGDLIDRGPDSEALVSLIDQQSYFSILGNHEAMMIAGFERSSAVPMHKANGGLWFYRLSEAEQRHCVEWARKLPWAIELDVGTRRVGLIHAGLPANSWTTAVQNLRAIEEAWEAGAAFIQSSVADAARKFLWDRFLAVHLYQRILALGDAKRTLAEYKKLFTERQDRIAKAPGKLLAPYQINGIDDVYLGHNFVPTAIQVGNCHFLDTFRGHPGEALSILCVNER
ncbi:metallophosphoesterase [Microbulbifer litoralis]|uniref:metallophosphoesterase n=1 Tax=Microbulbifer litoralis TaxID=2933965 RepID=UPI002027FEA7|nr:metallophosphoesterase [Microbulbifer sp. GX H0434]